MNNDLCESIINQANQLYTQLANLNSQLNESGNMINNQPAQQNTSPFQGLTILLLMLFAVYALLSFFSPQRTPEIQKGNQLQPQSHQDEDD